jgi:hypothetical protein
VAWDRRRRPRGELAPRLDRASGDLIGVEGPGKVVALSHDAAGHAAALRDEAVSDPLTGR